MTRILLLTSLVLSFTLQVLAGELVDLSLVDGSRIKGEVMSVTAQEVTLKADFGMLRIDLAKLTPESKAKLNTGAKADTESLMRRIAELEAKVSQLQQENESLRKKAVPIVSSTPSARPNSSAPSVSGSSAVSGLKYSKSSTGKRHNSGCRYFNPGYLCGPNDGIPCKICGG